MATDRRTLWTAAVLACAVLVAGCSGSEPRKVVERSGGLMAGTQISFRLPQGLVQVTVGPAQSVDAGSVDSGSEPSGRYIPVSWTWELGAGVPQGTRGYVSLASNKTATVSAEIGGRRHRLGSAYGTEKSADGSGTTYFVPVKKSATAADLEVEVAFEGVAQSARGDGSSLTTGRASALYEQRPGREARCSVHRVPRNASADDACTAWMVRRPYVDDLGWADEGLDWLIVSLGVSTYDRRGTVKTELRHTEGKLTVAGAPPSATLSSRGVGTADSSSVVVFPAASPEAQVDFSFTLDVDDPGTLVRGVATER